MPCSGRIFLLIHFIIAQDALMQEALGDLNLSLSAPSTKRSNAQANQVHLDAENKQPLSMVVKKKTHRLTVLSLWLCLGLWVFLSPPFTPPLNPIRATQEKLRLLSLTLVNYKTKFKEYPNNLSDLRKFSLSLGQNLPLFDAFGERIDYVRLTSSSYLLRSFGEDGVQNTLDSTKDIGLIKWGHLPRGGAYYASKPKLIPHFYRAASLMGLDSPDGSWLARLFTNKIDQKRYLVVRHRTIPDLVMIAPHDRVEEFYWVSQNSIVFSATESQKTRDGLYIWNLRNDSVFDLLRSTSMDHVLEGMKISIFSDQVDRGYWISLAGYNAELKQIYAYITAKDSYLLDPDYFFSPENLFEYTLDDDPKKIMARKITRDQFLGITAPKKFFQNPLTEKLSLGTPFTPKKPSALGIQEAWLKLPKTGRLEPSLLAWQQFSIKHSETPLFPYSLWYLISLYNESFLLVQTVNARDSEILRTYGVEISRALMNDTMAPSYLRAMGAHGHQILLKGQPLSYRIFNKMTLK